MKTNPKNAHLLTTNKNIYDIYSIEHVHNSFLYIHSEVPYLFVKNDINTLIFDDTYNVIHYDKIKDIKTSLTDINKNEVIYFVPSEISKELFSTISHLNLKEIDGLSYDIKKNYFKLLEETITSIEHIFLFFLSNLHSTFYQEKKIKTDTELLETLKDFMNKKKSTSHNIFLKSFNHDRSQLISINFNFSTKGINIPFETTLSIDETPTILKNSYNQFSKRLKVFLQQHIDNVKDIEKKINQLNHQYFKNIQHDFNCFPISTHFLEKCEFKKSKKFKNNHYYFLRNLWIMDNNPIFHSNLYLYKNNKLNPIYRTNDFLLEIEL